MVMYKGKKYAAAFVENIIKGSPSSKSRQARHLSKKCRKPSATRKSVDPDALGSLCKKRRRSSKSKSKSRSRSRSRSSSKGSKGSRRSRRSRSRSGSKGKKHRRSSKRSQKTRRSTRRRTATKKYGF
jgi:hypothetical protein